MKILEQIRKANQRLIKHIEQQIDLLDIDPENTNVQSFRMFIDDTSSVLQVIKQKHLYRYDITLTNFIGNLRACFKFNEYTGKVRIIKIYENNILGFMY
mgnify:FL=1